MENTSKRYYAKNAVMIREKRRIRYMIQKATTFICQECGNKYRNYEERFSCFDCEEAELLYAPASASAPAEPPATAVVRKMV